MWNRAIGNDESNFVSQINNMSTLVLTVYSKDSILLLTESIFNCAHIKWLTFVRRKFFKISLAESGGRATATFSADIDSYSRLMFKVLVDEITVRCIFDMCNTAFFLFDSLFSELTLSGCQLDLNKKFEKFLQNLQCHKNWGEDYFRSNTFWNQWFHSGIFMGNLFVCK